MKRLILLASFIMGYAFTSSQALASSGKMFDCNGCSSAQMKAKATQMWTSGNSADAHVFNETDGIYKKYWIYKETVAQGEEAWTQISASDRAPDPSINAAFQDMVIAKAQLKSSLDGQIFVYSNGGVQSDSEVNFHLTHALGTTNRLNVAFKLSGSSTPEICNGAQETAPTEKTAHDFLTDSTLRAQLFNDIRNEHDLQSVGNVTEFFVKNKTLFDAIAASGVPVYAQLGSTLGVIGADAGQLKIATVDGGFMLAEMDFRKETMVITFAKDGNCNEIPMNESEVKVVDFNFSSLTGGVRMENYISRFGVNIPPSNLGVCPFWRLACSSTPGLTTCTKYCRQTK
jgi:hypothetical protein